MAFTLGRVKGNGGDALTAVMTMSLCPNHEMVSDVLIIPAEIIEWKIMQHGRLTIPSLK